VLLAEKNCPREVLNLTYAGAGVFGAFSSFPACYSRPLVWDRSVSGRRGHFGTASCGHFAEVGWGLGSRGHCGGEAGSPSPRANGLAGEWAGRGDRPGPSYLQGQEAGGISGGGEGLFRYGLDVSDRSYGSPIHPYRYSFNGKEDLREKRCNPRETSFQRFGKGRRTQNIGSIMDVLELARQAKARTSMVEVDRLRPLSADSLPMDVSSNLITPMETLNQE
jgi:hypothetical protein